MPLPKSKSEFEKISAKNMVYENTLEWIIEGQLLPGEKLIDSDIADYFNVSRTPVREAFQLLESQKLIKSYPGKTTVVAELETDNIEKYYIPMACLQELAMSLAIDKITPKSIEKFKKINREFEDCIKKEKKTMDILQIDKDFHSLIIEIADNEYIADFCGTLWMHILRLEYMFFRDASLMESVDEHNSFIEAMEMKDSYTATLLAKAHWNRTAMIINEIKNNR